MSKVNNSEGVKKLVSHYWHVLSHLSKTTNSCHIEENIKQDDSFMPYECNLANSPSPDKGLIHFSLNFEKEAIFLTKDGGMNIEEYLNLINDVLADRSKPFKLIIKAHEIIIDKKIILKSDSDITFISKGNIKFLENGTLIKQGQGSLYLKAGIENDKGSVVFHQSNNLPIKMEDNSQLVINYHPEALLTDSEYSHKYHNPYSYSNHVEPSNSVKSYMLVNDIQDLQDINLFLNGNYALSRNINGSVTKNWNDGKGFKPLKLEIRENPTPFSGNFDGNEFSIFDLYINRPEESFIGLFGMIKGYESCHTSIMNINLTNFQITGNKYVGGVVGHGQYTRISNIIENNINIQAAELAGGVAGSAQNVQLDEISCDHLVIKANEYGSRMAGVIKNYNIIAVEDCCIVGAGSDISENACFSYIG